MSDGNKLLMQSGTKWVSFKVFNKHNICQILAEPEVRQQRDFDDPDVKLFWPNGDPRMEVVVEVMTAERDPEIENDQGVRSLHIKGNMIASVREAVKRTGAPGLEVGGILDIAWTGVGEQKGKGEPPKSYTSVYTRPASAGNGALMQPQGPGTPVPPPSAPTMEQILGPAAGNPSGFVYREPAAAAPPQMAPQLAPQLAPAPTYAQPPAPVPAYLQPPVPVPPVPAGVDPEMWGRMSPEQRAAVQAAMGQVPPF